MEAKSVHLFHPFHFSPLGLILAVFIGAWMQGVVASPPPCVPPLLPSAPQHFGVFSFPAGVLMKTKCGWREMPAPARASESSCVYSVQPPHELPGKETVSHAGQNALLCPLNSPTRNHSSIIIYALLCRTGMKKK